QRPLKIGFHLPSWISYFVSLSEVAHAFLKWRKSGKLEDLKNFTTQYEALPWKEQHEERKESAILALCDSRPRGLVPGAGLELAPGRVIPPVVLLGAADTQGRYFKYAIRAFAYGPSEESWLVQCGTVTDFEDLAALFWKSVYYDASGKEYMVRKSIIDAMGNRTPSVYRFCIANRGRIVPFQGVQHLSAPFKPSPQESFMDEKGRQIVIPGGMVLYRGDITYFKSDLAHKLQIKPDDPGAFHLHSNIDPDKPTVPLLEEYAREMCAEVWSEEANCWLNPHERDNHFWDVEHMLLLLAYQLGIRNWKSDDSRPAQNAGPPAPRRGSRPAADKLSRIRR
ncbi:phage terminase large subunit family protein, partial [Desulfovibrio sp. OttesenSCG-928-G11]|nr:phage terminase large subunit family protein [Desulfovibrio sp. OttesenSCG-928-G11]